MSETLSVVVEREFPHKPEKLWRALTQPHLIQEWLMKNDFQPALGHKFRFREDYLPNGALDCEVLALEPNRKLSYSWDSTSDTPMFNAKTVVTFTLTATGAGTLLRLEQSGFRRDQPQAYGGAKQGWPMFLGKLEQLLMRAE